MTTECERGQDKRRHHRVQSNADVMVRIGDIVLYGTCINGSMGGMLLNLMLVDGVDPATLALRSGEVFLIQRSGAEEFTFEAGFVVAWAGPSPESPTMVSLGISFTTITTENSLNLFRLIRWNSWA